ncbi:UNVERIFIED_CONTAM: hypothetical protein K2H54_060647 [Gekko kuhli]
MMDELLGEEGIHKSSGSPTGHAWLAMLCLKRPEVASKKGGLAGTGGERQQLHAPLFDELLLSDENKTAFFELEFSVPPESETEEFMKNRMSEMFVKNILRQNIYDHKEIYGVDATGCTYLTLDPTSLSVSSIQAINTDG